MGGVAGPSVVILCRKIGRREGGGAREGVERRVVGGTEPVEDNYIHSYRIAPMINVLLHLNCLIPRELLTNAYLYIYIHVHGQHTQNRIT